MLQIMRKKINSHAPLPQKCHSKENAQICKSLLERVVKREFPEKSAGPPLLLAFLGPVHLIPSLCCDEACSTSHVTLGCGAHSQAALQERNAGPVRETAPAGFGPLSRSVCGEFSDAWPLVQNPPGDDGSSCGSCPELAGEDAHSLSPESESLASWDSRSAPDLDGGTLPVQAHSENVTETPDSPGQGSALTEPVPTHSGHAGGEKPARSRERPRP